MSDKAGKPYGLVLMKKPGGGSGASKSFQQGQRSIFDDSDDEDTQGKKKKSGVGESKVKKQVQKQWEEALEQDPSAFAYDEVYDQLAKQKEEKSEATKADKDRKPKYIQQLLTTAEKRQREFEAREERKQQKELEKDAELHADKEVFVTAAYRKKMEELAVYNAEEKRKEQLEALLDVTKQKDLSGFYRHFLNDYEKATSSTNEDASINESKEMDVEESPVDTTSESQISKPSFPVATSKPRTFRQRRESSSSETGSPPRKEIREDFSRQRTISQASGETEFDIQETKENPISGARTVPSSKTLTRGEQQRRRYFTPSPSPPPPQTRKDLRQKDKNIGQRQIRRSSEKSPKRTSPDNDRDAKKPTQERILTDEEVVQKRMEKLRGLLKKRNDEASINEYRKRYFERKSAIVA